MNVFFMIIRIYSKQSDQQQNGNITAVEKKRFTNNFLKKFVKLIVRNFFEAEEKKRNKILSGTICRDSFP